jgi:hypothetical protein
MMVCSSSAAQVRSSPHQRGILISAGGRKLTTHLLVTLRVLRHHLRCRLPVEVAWQGPREMDEATLAALDRDYGPVLGLDVSSTPYPEHQRRWDWANAGRVAGAGWQTGPMLGQRQPEWLGQAGMLQIMRCTDGALRKRLGSRCLVPSPVTCGGRWYSCHTASV